MCLRARIYRISVFRAVRLDKGPFRTSYTYNEYSQLYIGILITPMAAPLYLEPRSTIRACTANMARYKS